MYDFNSGIVGLPVVKSTLLNAITKAGAGALSFRNN